MPIVSGIKTIDSRERRGVMVFQEKTYCVLVVSSTESFGTSMAPLLPPTDYYPVVYARSSGEAQRLLAESSYDIVIINTPLSDDFGLGSGVLRGAVAMVGCNNPRVRPDSAHIELMKKLIKNDIILVLSGCSAQAAARAGLMDKEAKNLCGAGLKRVCELADIPPVLHMGSCVDISRMMVLASQLAKDSGLNISQLPLVGCAPEWMSEKAVSIGNYVVATGIDTFLGVEPQVSGSSQVTELLTGGIRDWVEAAYTVETDIEKLGDMMIARIEEKRAALGI